ncbi:autotransporter outer membrane beta-barrel domain-containing protein [Leminorella grimontii]|uniref:autotransporter outer membrane beta-barrel domain-containing protein n=1 Tax=Leminorella grimontii TaxID=82981 RepID=UPI0021C4A6A7|nr:autotransporter outer membrane beta-barrel domain-containing protein [Leminorella grimontii]
MNKVYRIVWNSALMKWVVASELARGKIKNATPKLLAGTFSLLLSGQPMAATCDSEELICRLGDAWAVSTNNNRNGMAVISDGNTYAVSGVTSWASGESTYIVLSDLNSIISNSYPVTQGGSPVTSLPTTDKTIVYPGLTQSVLVYDPITRGNISVLVYNSASFTDKDAYKLPVGISFMKNDAAPYIDTRLVHVDNGVANISLDKNAYSIGELRESSLVYVDGTTANRAEANWLSKQTVSAVPPGDWHTISPLSSFTSEKDQYVGTFSTFNGSMRSVNSLSDFKAYNDWLISKLSSGELSYSNYQTELGKAYTSTSTVYQFSRFPAGKDASTYGSDYMYWFHAKGENALVTVASGGGLDVLSGSSATFNTFRVEDRGNAVNNGEVLTTGRLAWITSGGTLTNNGLLSLGGRTPAGSGSYQNFPIYVSDVGSKFINNSGGVYTVSPRYYYTNKTSNGNVDGVSLYAGATGENRGTINAGYWGSGVAEQVTGNVNAARVFADASFVNAESGNINLGFAQNGVDLAYLSSGGSGIMTQSSGSGENKGTITLSAMSDGNYGMYGLNWSKSLRNSGTINVNSNGDNGRFIPTQSIGIYSLVQAVGNVVNTGTINLNGLNSVGIKTLSGGKAASSGTINVAGGVDTATGLRNYGVWAEGSGSKVDVSGEINLKGDGAIGVHARSAGSIALSGDAQVAFTDGENQIGYYIYGTGSAINNASSGVQDVTTDNSTLMRLDGGASFTGSAAATSTMSASGDGSTVIVATGTGTTVNSGGMTVNVNGENATGFLVEGGAVGTIGATATINLSGQGAIAGIADGQGHDLNGAQKTMTDAQKKATKLTSSADLNSSLDGVVGYIARNQATLTNSGNIAFSGNNATGIHVEEGAIGVNSGNIMLSGKGSVGLVATANTTTTRLSSTGSLTLNGDWDGSSDATRSTGVLAQGSQVDVTVGDGATAAAISLNGAGTVGVHATGGSTVKVNNNVAVNFDSNKSDQIAYWVDGSGSKIITSAGATPTNVVGDGATLFYVTNEAAMSGDLNLNLSGKAGSSKTTSGVRVNGAGSEATLGAASQLTIGTNATGVLAENGGKATIAQGAAFSVSGANAVVGLATDTGSLVENNASVTSLAGSSGSTAFRAENDGSVDNKGTIDLSAGSGHTAIDVDNGHVANTGNISANGTAIHIKGAASTISNSGTIEAVDGVAAIHVDAGAGLDLSAVSGSGTIVAKGTADGILLDTGATGLNVADTLINMSDASSSGIGIHNVAGISGIQLSNTDIDLGGTGIGIKTGASLAKTNSGTINVTDGTGILYLNENGSAVASDIDISDSSALTINVAGSGVGVKATLDGNSRAVNTGVSVNVNSASGGAAVDVSGAQTVINSGDLTSQSTSSPVMDVHNAETISNSGAITASSATLAAVVMSNTGSKTFTNIGDITGSLDFTSGDNQINLTGGTLTGNIAASGGANTLNATNGSVHTGNVTLLGNKANAVNVSGSSTLGNLAMTGGGNHQISVSETSIAGDMTLGNGANRLTVDNSAVADVTAGSGSNVVTLQNGAHLDSFAAGAGGENSVTVKNDATFGTLDAGVGGANDSLTFDGTDYTLTNAAAIQHFDVLNLTNGADFTTDQLIQMGDTATSTGRIAIDGASSLVLNPTGAYTLNHALSGSGLIDVQSCTVFDFGSAAGNQFAGRVNMGSDDFALSGFNTTALTKAILSVMGNNVSAVGSGVQTIGGLVFSGGTVDFGVSIPNASISPNRIVATTLDASGTGKVMIDQGGFDNATTPIVNQTKGLLDQQTETLVQLASTTSVTGEGGNLQLVDESGAAISNASLVALLQDGVHAADAYYDYRLTTKDNNGTANGLYVGYGLTQLDLLTSGSNELVINTANSNEKVLSAKVTGSGDLGIVAGNGASALTLSNLDNGYTGETDLQAGTLIVGANNALGQTSNLKLATTTIVNLNGKTQTVGELNGSAGSTLNLNGGSLTLSNGSTSSGALTGSGELTVAGGVLTVANANSDLTATTTVNAGAEALLQNVQALGTGAVVANGDVTLDNAAGTFANAVSGSGNLNANSGSDVVLSGNNSGFTGEMNIDAASTLTVSENQHVGGTIAVNNANKFIVNNGAAMTLASVVNGTGDLVKTSVGTLTLAGANAYSGKTDIQNGTVAISADANLGDGSVTNLTTLNGGSLQITSDMTSARDVTLEKSGRVIVDGGVTATMNGWVDGGNAALAITKAGDGVLVWLGDNSANMAAVNVTGGTLRVESLTNLASSTGLVNLGASGTLSILKDGASADDVDFTRQLSGSGTLQINLGNKDNDFTFNSSATGGGFSGTVSMDNGRFVLDTSADSAMGLATLKLNGDGAQLGSMKLEGTHAIGGLTLNGGQLEVDYSSVDHRPTGYLTVNTLDVTGGGTLAVTTPANLPNPLPVTGASLFDQDDGVYDQIVAATTVSGSGSQIAVTKADGTAIAPDTVVGLIQSGTQAGNAHYNYFGSVKTDGLYLGYGLTQLDSFAGQSVLLSNAGATDNSLSARLTGDGGFTINGTGTARIGNATSDYRGATDVNTGSVVLITDSGFGQTSSLNMQSGTAVDLNGNAQAVGLLNTAATSTLNLNGGELTVSNGGLVGGHLSGQGELLLTGGTLSITQNNSSLTASTDIASGTTARLTKPQGLGTGDIGLDGVLELDMARGTLLNALSGSGEMTLTNGADMYLGGNNQNFDGQFTTNVGTTLTATTAANLGDGSVNNSGRFVLDNNDLWALTNEVSGSGTLVKRGMGTVQIDGSNVQAGMTDVENGLLLVGGASDVASQAVLTSNVNIMVDGALGGYGGVTGSVTNGGNLIMGRALGGDGASTFTINGNYIGNGGTVTFNTDLGGDNSVTDKLVINGDTAGSSFVAVMSARGDGAQTVDGIRLIDVAGNSAGQFTLKGRAVAGAYEYFLHQGGVATPNDGDWYLRSQILPPSPVPDPTPSDSVIRPEAASYTANIAAAGQMFNLRLEDREGRAENSSMWLRQEGSRTTFHDTTGQSRTATNTYVIQGGGEVWDIHFSDSDRLGLGVMAGYGNAKSDSHSSMTGYRSEGSVDGYSAGVYGTWYQNAASLSGLYVDSWMQYSWLNGSVNGEGLSSEGYDINGLSASVETGYRASVYEGENGQVFVTPQAQVIWSGIKADDHTEANGTRVKSSGDNNVQTRLGVKVSRDGVSDMDKGRDKLFTVYAEVNWLNNSQQAGAVLDNVEVKQSGSRNLAEMKVGTEGQINKHVNLWSNVTQQLGDDGYSDTAVMLGIKYRF